MTRRGFIKRIGGVAASAVAVVSLPALDIITVKITPKGPQITPMPVDMIESAFGLSRNGMTYAQFRDHVRKIVHDYHPVRIDGPLPMKIRNNPVF